MGLYTVTRNDLSMAENGGSDNNSKKANELNANAAKNNNAPKGDNKFLAFLLAPPTIPLILGTVFLIVARIVNASAVDVRVMDLWPEWLYGFALIVVGVFLMFVNGFKEPKESFLPALKSPLLRRLMRFAPLLASVVLFYIASTVARASDDVNWKDVTFELMVSAALFALGVFFLFKV